MLNEQNIHLLPKNYSAGIPLTIWLSSVIGILLLSMVAMFVYNRTVKPDRKISLVSATLDFVFQVLKKPISFLITAYILYAFFNIAQIYVPELATVNKKIFTVYLLKVIEISVFFWIVFNALRIGKIKLIAWSVSTEHRVWSIILPAISSSLQAALFLFALNLLIPAIGLVGLPEVILAKLAKVLLITTLAWVFFQCMSAFERLIINQYVEHNDNILAARSLNTQVVLLKRIILSLAAVVFVSAVLMVFDSVKTIGTGLLTTAGIISAVGAFASQQSISRLFAGLQIAFTQPIRIGDTVIIDKEFGQIEEITLSYVVVKLWDLRRMILPTDYFTGKGLLNLTRNSTQLLGTVFLYVDYTLPIENVRKAFFRFLEESTLWDKRVGAFQVTDLKESTMEIRALMSAENASTLFDLRCQIREKLITYISKNFPDSLSKLRNLSAHLTTAGEADVGA